VQQATTEISILITIVSIGSRQRHIGHSSIPIRQVHCIWPANAHGLLGK